MNLFSFRRRRLPIVLQDANGECGIACLAMVAGWHGHRLEYAHLKAAYPTTRRGLSLANLAAVADSLNFDVRGYQIEDIKDLKNVRLPAVLHWTGNHFVVLKAVKGGEYVIHNPAVGIRQLVKDDVEENFTGFVLEMHPNSAFRTIVQEKRYPLGKILELTYGLRASIVQVVVVAVVGSVITMLMPLFVQAAIDSVLPQSDTDLLFALAVGLLLVSLSIAFADWLKTRIVSNVGGAFFAQLTRNAVGQLFRLPLSYFEGRHPGDIATRLESVDHIRVVVTRSFVAAAVDGIMILLSGLVMFLYAPSLAIIVTSIFLVVIGIRIAVYPRMRRDGTTSLKARSEERAKLIDSLRAIATLKAANATAPVASRWYDSFIQYVNATFRIQMTEANALLAVEIVTAIGTALTLYLGIAAVLRQEMTVGMLYAFFTYRTLFFGRIDNLVSTMTEVSMLGANMGRLADFIELEPEAATAVVERQIRTSVRLRQATYRAGFADKPILHETDFEIAPDTGRMIAIIGPSGSGKTTLLKLLAGLYSPSTGTMEVDGVPVERWGLGAYRRNFGLLLGVDKLMHGSIVENVTMFEIEPDRSKVMVVLKVAELDDAVANLPRGLDSVVSEENGLLSGGQRRRLMLARALYHDPGILLLDEVTANLDPETAARIINNLRAHSATKIITSHDLYVLKACDEVFQMKDGRLERDDSLKQKYSLEEVENAN